MLTLCGSLLLTAVHGAGNVKDLIKKFNERNEAIAREQRPAASGNADSPVPEKAPIHNISCDAVNYMAGFLGKADLNSFAQTCKKFYETTEDALRQRRYLKTGVRVNIGGTHKALDGFYVFRKEQVPRAQEVMRSTIVPRCVDHYEHPDGHYIQRDGDQWFLIYVDPRHFDEEDFYGYMNIVYIGTAKSQGKSTDRLTVRSTWTRTPDAARVFSEPDDGRNDSDDEMMLDPETQEKVLPQTATTDDATSTSTSGSTSETEEEEEEE